MAAAVLAVHAWLIVGNVAMDGDTLRLASELTRVEAFRGSLSHLGSRVVLYAAQPPVLWAAARAAALVRPPSSPLLAARFLAILSILAVAWLLAAIAREAGAGPAGRFAAAMFPFCWHGFSYLAISCDDNLPADALRLGVILAATRWLASPGGGRRHLAAGAAFGATLGVAVCWHFQSVLLFPAVAVAGFAGWRRPGRLRETMTALFLGAAVWAAFVALCLAGGLGAAPSPAALAAAATGNHHDPRLWLPASPRSLAEQAGLVGEGWSRMVIGFGWLRPAGAWGLVAAAVGLLAAAGAVSLAAIVRTPLGVVLAAVLALEIPHSLLYEPESIERWDVPAMLAGLAGVAAVARLRRAGAAGRARRLAAAWGALAALLLACNLTAYVRFARGAEAAFLDVLAGRRAIEGLNLDCTGAHWRLCRAARSFAGGIGSGDGFGGFVQPRLPDAYHQHYLNDWLAAYVMCYSPGFLDRRGSVCLCLFRPPPPGLFRILRQEGFLYLALRLPPRN